MMLEYKRVPFELKELIESKAGGWEIAGYASTFWGEADSYNDVVAPGCFKASIEKRPTKFLYEHLTPIGKQLEIHEDDHGLFGRWSIVDTAIGTDAYKLAKAGVLDSLSIGYMTLESDFRDDGVRVLRAVDLLEVSCVALPANPNAVITDVKTGRAKPFDAHSEDVRVAVREWLERIKSGSDIRQKDGKEPLSDARRELVAAVSGSLRLAADEVEALLVPPPPPEVVNVGMELRRRRYASVGITLERPA